MTCSVRTTPVCPRAHIGTQKDRLDALPYGATRAADWIPRVLCGMCQGVNFGAYMFCQLCRAPAYRGPPMPRTTEAPAAIIDSKLNERIREL